LEREGRGGKKINLTSSENANFNEGGGKEGEDETRVHFVLGGGGEDGERRGPVKKFAKGVKRS